MNEGFHIGAADSEDGCSDPWIFQKGRFGLVWIFDFFLPT